MEARLGLLPGGPDRVDYLILIAVNGAEGVKYFFHDKVFLLGLSDFLWSYV